jgi:hypothetical protein
MHPAQLAHPRLDLGRQLPPDGDADSVIGRSTRAGRLGGSDAATRAPSCGTPIAFGDLNDRDAAGEDLHDGVITLLHDAQLHEHQPRLPPRDSSRAKQTRGRQCYPSCEASVSPINRSQTTVSGDCW